MFQRCAILLPEGGEARAAVAAARRLVEPGGGVALVGWQRPHFWHLGDPWSQVDARVEGEEARLEALAAELRGEGYWAYAAVHLAGEPPVDALGADVDCVVLLADSTHDELRSWTERLLEAGFAVAWARPEELEAREARPVEHAVVAYLGGLRRALPGVELLRRWAAPDAKLTVLRLESAKPSRSVMSTPRRLRELIGWPGPVRLEELPTGLGSMGGLGAWVEAHEPELVVVPTPAASLARSRQLRALAAGQLQLPLPVLLVPPPKGALDAARLDGPDVLRVPGRPLVARIDTVDPLGRAHRLPSGELAAVFGGEPKGKVVVREGEVPLPDALIGEARAARLETLGFASPGASLARLRVAIRILDPDASRPIALFDAEDPVDAATFEAFDDGRSRVWLGVRLDTSVPCRSLRARWSGLPVAGLIDAGSVLADGDPDDLPTAARPLRLARVARHLRLGGRAVDLVIGPVEIPGVAHCRLTRWNTLDAGGRRARIAERYVSPPANHDDHARLRALTDARPIVMSRLEVEFDNRAARRKLLAAIDGAQGQVDLQTYMFEVDGVGEAVSQALQAAHDRGVRVRVLVDSFLSGHGTMGRTNPVLVPLEARGCLRTIRPFSVPGIDELKRRDHRKLFVVDGELAWVSGRNIGAPYYTGFEEVALDVESSYRAVPWLDAGLEIEGPAVKTIAAAFERNWRISAGEVAADEDRPEGGAGRGAAEGMPVDAPSPEIRGWFIEHESMGDTRTLDAYRHLVDTARSRITLVNSFPLQFELLQALHDALGRGVAVRFLVGHVRPLHGPSRVPFRGGAIRSLATEVIMGRLDLLVAAGGEARAFAVEELAPWQSGLGTVLPHVHAKVVSVDGARFAIGSANLDITAGYWESEALVIVEDRGETARLDGRLDGLFAAGEPIDAGVRSSSELARRTWVSRHWPSLIG